MQFIHDVIYCASAREQFAVIHNTMFNSICSYKSTDYSFTITCMSQHCKIGSMICTANIYTDTNKVDI